MNAFSTLFFALLFIVAFTVSAEDAGAFITMKIPHNLNATTKLTSMQVKTLNFYLNVALKAYQAKVPKVPNNTTMDASNTTMDAINTTMDGTLMNTTMNGTLSEYQDKVANYTRMYGTRQLGASTSATPKTCTQCRNFANSKITCQVRYGLCRRRFLVEKLLRGKHRKSLEFTNIDPMASFTCIEMLPTETLYVIKTLATTDNFTFADGLDPETANTTIFIC